MELGCLDIVLFLHSRVWRSVHALVHVREVPWWVAIPRAIFLFSSAGGPLCCVRGLVGNVFQGRARGAVHAKLSAWDVDCGR